MLQPRLRSAPCPPGPCGASQNQPSATGNLAGRHGFGAVAVLIGAQDEIVAIDGNFLGVPGLHFHLGHDVVPTQIVAERFLDRGGVKVDGDVEDHVVVFAARRGRRFLGGAGNEKRGREEDRKQTRDHGQNLYIDYSGWYNISLTTNSRSNTHHG